MKQHFMGLEHVWFIGVVENRMDPLKTGRVQVRKYGWDSPSNSMQPTAQLIWAQIEIPVGSNDVSPPREGTMVRGYFLDGQAGQFPMICAIIPGIPETIGDPSQGFNDPRTTTQLKNAPRPPQSVTLPTNGSGVTIQEASNASRYPTILNEPSSSRIARNENIQDTIVQQKRNNVLQNIPVGTGSLTLPGIDLSSFLSIPAIGIPPISANFNINVGVEFCGLGIGLNLNAGFSFGGLQLTPPVILSSGVILINGINIGTFFEGKVALGKFVSLAVSIAGCILGGSFGIGGNSITIDGGISLPLLPTNISLNLSTIGIRGTIFGGVSFGTIGGIPVGTPPMWNEPAVPYNANYPYNHVITQSESGHVIEVDDTPGAERIHTYHRSGTFDEMGPNGNRVAKTTNNQFNIIYADHNTNVMGSQHNTVNQDQTNLVKGDRKETISGNHMCLVSGDATKTVTGASQDTISKDAKITILQNRYVDVKGDDQQVYEGNQTIAVLENCNIIVKGTGTIAVQGDLQIGTQGNMTLTSGQTFTINCNEYVLNATADADIGVAGDYKVSATNINYNLLGSYIATLQGTYETVAAHTNMTPLPNH